MPSLGTGDEIGATSRRVGVLIVHDQPMLASEIAGVLNGEVDLAVVGVSGTGADAVKASVQHQPDVVLMEYRLPDVSGPSAAEMILDAHPTASIVFYSADDSEDALLDAVDVGAVGYLTKNASPWQIVEAVRRAAQGDVLIPVELFGRAIARQRNHATGERERDKMLAIFTPREFEVLQLLALGFGTGQVSRRLGIAPHTVEWHVRHLIEKLQVHSRLQVVVAAARLGLIDIKNLD